MILANTKLELHLLATCLVNGNDTTKAAAFEIGEQDFTELNHRDAWKVLNSLLDSRDTIDFPAFDTRWPKVAGTPRPPVEIYEAAAEAGLADDLPACISEVKEWTRRRIVHGHALKLAAVAANPKGDLETAVAECQIGLKASIPAGHNEIDPAKAVDLHIADLEYRHSLGDKLSGISTGFHCLDECTDGFQKSELSVFGARPSHGKSALLLGFAHHAAFTMKRPVLFISLEMSIEMLMRRLNAMDTGINLGCMKRGKLTEQDFYRITNGFIARMKNAPLWFYNGNTGMNILKVRNIARRHIEEHGVELVIVDYLQRIPSSQKHEKRTYEVAEVSSGLQALALEHKIHVCTAAQLNREPDKTQGKKEVLPRICHLADSAQIDRDGDLICLLHRKDMAEEAQLIVAKQRDGAYAVQHLWFDREHCMFKEGQETP